MINELFYNAVTEDGTSVGNFLSNKEVDEFIARCAEAVKLNPEILEISNRRVQISKLVSSRPFYRHGVGIEPSLILGNMFLDTQSADQIHQHGSGITGFGDTASQQNTPGA